MEYSEDDGMKIILAGGTGFIGRALVERIVKEKQKCILITRNPERVTNFYNGLLRVERWDEHAPVVLPELIDEGDAIVNLAGESLAAGRWTQERKKRLLQSRTTTTEAFVKVIERSKKKPSVFMNASAVGYYGDIADVVVAESFSRGNDFLASLVGQWEASAMEAAKSGVRVVLLRTGVVLDKAGGALTRLKMPFRFYMGGWLGSGKQWFPWIHRADVVEIILSLIKNPRISGPVNVVAPQQVTMKEFSIALSQVMRRPCWVRVPSPVLRFVLGEMADMLLTGSKVVPVVLRESGYQFQYPTIEKALSAILGPHT